MSQITTHVLDTAQGKPASGIYVQLFRENEGERTKVGDGSTNHDGRINDLVNEDLVLDAGSYRLVFSLENYFNKTEQQVFYPSAEIVFRIPRGGQHYHLPLLLSPFSYSTYRGS